ncbi:hypothetical protein M9H77_20313 [Catharanthus roseus]|uniref:Uncharacterized protein n=1 Tax=Catharanthus roseus TaxID=4058 RepID=A0ACC0AKT2_CATRO|nr:hypothetical protein M9H77_20313 [Catharanthus roseus]
MAMFGSSAPTEVGLRLLLSPLGSNILTRTACCSVGIVLPVYSTFKAIESKDQNDQQKWLVYWAAYGSFSIVEIFTDKFLYWVPLYYQVKFAFLVWLQLPSVEGAKQLYAQHLRPFLVKHQARFDKAVGMLYGEMSKFASTHQAEFQLAKTIFTRTFLAVRDVIYPVQHKDAGAIEGPVTAEETSESDDDDE